MNKLRRALIVITLIGQMCCQGIYIPGLSQFPAYIWCLILLSCIALYDFVETSSGKIHFSKKQKFNIVSILLILNICFVYIINSQFPIDRIMLIVTSFLFCLACFQSIKCEEDIRFLQNWYLAAACISSLVAIGQVLNIPLASELWRMTHVSTKLDSAISAERYLGLATDSLQFGYYVSAAMAILLFIHFKKGNLIKKILLNTIFIFALIANNTRSAQISVVIMILLWIFACDTNRSKKGVKLSKLLMVVGLCFVSAVLIYYGEEFFASTRYGDVNDGASARVPMILTAFNHALHYPLGSGSYNVVPEFIVGTNNITYQAVLNNTAHNLLGNCVASYGFIGLILMIMLYLNVFDAYKRSRAFLSTRYVTGAMLAVVCLFVNAFFHNSYILNGDLSTFFNFAIVLSSAKLVMSKEEDTL